MTIIVDLSGGGTGGSAYWSRDTTGDPFLTPKNSGDNLVIGATNEAGVTEVKNASAVVKVKLNSVGDSFITNFLGLGTETPSCQLSINGSISRKMTDAGAANYNPSALTNDYKITANNTAATRNIVISTEDIQSGTVTQPREFLVSDYYGQAGTNPLVVSGESGTINGVASVSLTTNYESMHLQADGTNLTII